ncbi:MAG: bifunctional methylenetetrahydrofolate dehydrogenase/methenyltetrahydrofolate cyclohydrolase FolD [Deltaproteobacteria bacterium]|nr:bifunctional methylenetetrahydrofolate dehydrogenase/methenyltetrahydrofolate cyclohydrolase FolD [Deltaproteobacteria bacterium]
MTIILDGKEVASVRRTELAKRVASLKVKTGRAPGLAVVLVGENPASQIYVKNKIKACKEAGIESFHVELSGSITQKDLHQEIDKLNLRGDVDGILVQLPLPKGLNETLATERILPAKDPDGLTSGNLGLLFAGRTRVAPCTPYGVMKILEHFKIKVAGQNAVVIGRSNIVGKPMAQLLLEADATVTIAHSKTTDLQSLTSAADIVVVAAGRPRFLGREFFRQGSVVVDVGIHRVAENENLLINGKRATICGDVRFEELVGHVSAVTPVPGGVGPMTIQMLLENTLKLAELSQPER